jgi:thiol-disulfide isomerase/thioredoxin
MKLLAALSVSLVFLSTVIAQNEQAPIVEKEITYKNWTLKNVRDGREAELRSLLKGKKLVAVVYFAAWCPNWRHDAPMLERLYQKYKGSGFEIVGVAEYDSVGATKANIDQLKVSFPIFYESESRDDRLNTRHYAYRQATGDRRKWGSPWYIFIEPAATDEKNDVLLNKANVINGEMIESEGEALIRRKLGLPAETAALLSMKKNETQACDPDDLPILTKPDEKP